MFRCASVDVNLHLSADKPNKCQRTLNTKASVGLES